MEGGADRDPKIAPVPIASRLMLGTAQFGLDYGISNDLGQVPEDAAFAILDRAGTFGIRLLDTAPAYGNAEDLLGRYMRQSGATHFRIVSKVSLGTGSPEVALAGVRRSIDILGGCLEAVLMHAPHELASAAGERLWAGLLDLRDAGMCRRIGISAYVEDEPVVLAQRYHPDLIQVPLSVLDQRLADDGSIERLAGQRVAIHVRSIFLQGVVLVDPARLSKTLSSLRPHLERLRSGLRVLGLTPLEAALSYPLGLAGVEAVTVGVTRLTELDAILATLEISKTSEGMDWSSLACQDSTHLDPRRW